MLSRYICERQILCIQHAHLMKQTAFVYNKHLMVYHDDDYGQLTKGNLLDNPLNVCWCGKYCYCTFAPKLLNNNR